MLRGKMVKAIEKPVDSPVEDGAKKDVEVLTCKSLAVAVYKNPSKWDARVGRFRDKYAKSVIRLCTYSKRS